MNLFRMLLLPLVLAFVLGACSGGDNFNLGGGSENQGASNEDSGGDSGGAEGEEDTPVIEAPAVTLALGTGSGGAFVSGAMTTTVDGSELSYGGDAAVTVNIVDASDNSLYTASPVTVNFTSNCVLNGQSTIDASKISATGSVTATYSATTCSGIDTVVASIDGATATTNITVADQSLGSLEAVSVTPPTISLRGTGTSAFPEASVVTFKLLDEIGNPIAGRTINFSLEPGIGGVSFPGGASTGSSVTRVDGTAAITVNAGSVNTTVAVLASITDPDTGEVIQTTSRPIAVVGGLPDDDSFSISVQTFNPRALEFDGVTNTITIRAADRFNNPAPDGTQVNFVTTGGAIVGTCALSGGSCSVDWTSQDPRPADGLVTVLATTIGEESFIDENGDGVFDEADGDSIVRELDEAFIDLNGNTVRDAGEFFSDYNVNGSYDTKLNPGKFQGVNCSEAAIADGHCYSLVELREVATFCMAADGVVVSDNRGGANNVGGTMSLSAGQNTVTVNIQESVNGITPAAGTSVSVQAVDLEILSGDSISIPNTCQVGGVSQTIRVRADDDVNTTQGFLNITVTQADGQEILYVITVND